MSNPALLLQSSLLMWLLSVVVGVLSTLVALGWLRQAQLRLTVREQRRPALVAALVLGTGLCGMILLGLSAEILPFPIGYRLFSVGLLWLGAVAGCFVAVAWLARSLRLPALLGVTALLGALTFALQLGWVDALGLQPGLRWRRLFMVAAAVLGLIAMGAALGLAFSETGRWGKRRALWRSAAALMLALGVIGSQQLLLAGTDLPAQVSSVFRREVPGPLLSMTFGVLVPLACVVMLFDLRLKRTQQRRARRRERRSREPYYAAGGRPSGDPPSSSYAPSTLPMERLDDALPAATVPLQSAGAAQASATRGVATGAPVR